jgi:hypothetical protein
MSAAMEATVLCCSCSWWAQIWSAFSPKQPLSDMSA